MKSLLSAEWYRFIIMGLIIVLLFFLGVRHYNTIQPIEYEDHLSDTAVKVDGEELTLSDLSFYVLYEEQLIETDAMVYNKKNTRDFWNLHANGIFFKAAAKKAVMDMAVHDHLFYKAALDEGITLSVDELKTVNDRYNDFTEDLLLQQLDSPIYNEDVIKNTMEKIALAEKYQGIMADRDSTTYAGYGYDGYDFKRFLEHHEVKINKKIWDRINIGDNSISHRSANAINGQEFNDE